MAWRGTAGWLGGVGAREALGGFISTRVRVTAVNAGRASPCHGGSGVARTAGAADGLGVRRAHGAVRRRGRRGSRCLGRSERQGAWISGSACLGRRERQEGAWGHGCRGRPAHRRGARPARRRGAGRLAPICISLVHCLNSNFSKFLNRTRPSFEHESCRSSHPLQLLKRLYGVFLHKF
jgi:hypothetical protein